MGVGELKSTGTREMGTCGGKAKRTLVHMANAIDENRQPRGATQTPVSLFTVGIWEKRKKMLSSLFSLPHKQRSFDSQSRYSMKSQQSAVSGNQDYFLKS